MARRRMVSAPPPPIAEVPEEKQSKPEPPNHKVMLDVMAETSVIGTCALDMRAFIKTQLKLKPEHFQSKKGKLAWEAMLTCVRKGLSIEKAALLTVTEAEIEEYIELSKGYASEANLAKHIANIHWDFARATVSRGPVRAFLEAITDARAEPERVGALAKQIVQSLQNTGERPHLLRSDSLVAEAMREVEQRVNGHATYSYGVQGLDRHNDGRQRMIPGTAPGLLTVVTGVSGGGKSTFAANMALGMAFEHANYTRDASGRTVLFGAWEMRPSVTLESLAMTSLGWGRELARTGKGHIATEDGRRKLAERMALIAERVRFLELPFARQPNEKKQGANERNLDLIHSYLADCGCDVFIADLWERCLRETNPDDVSQALYRQQAMLQETRVHGVLLQQMRFKDVELRKDKRPTRESLKGTGAWVEVADAVLGVHWPYLHTGNDINALEVYVLKQRYGRWPLAVEFEYDPDSGSIARGKDAVYLREGENDVDAAVGPAPGGQLNRYSGNKSRKNKRF